MTNLVKGMIAGFVASVVLLILMYIEKQIGIMTNFSVLESLSKYSGVTGSVAAGWVMHLLIGTVFWGLLFAIMEEIIPGAYWVKGLIFGVLAWFLMMLIYMPSAEAGVFGWKHGYIVPTLTFVLHLVYGLILGWVYGMLKPTPRLRIE